MLLAQRQAREPPSTLQSPLQELSSFGILEPKKESQRPIPPLNPPIFRYRTIDPTASMIRASRESGDEAASEVTGQATRQPYVLEMTQTRSLQIRRKMRTGAMSA